ncbi:60S ribosomal protein L18a [Medicago truncatula]|uniref:60S ribosomal protein L18a n=1 Tax=Medicago truncatula TaxID=3880 RepID=G7IPY8_MEDTR|nr:60S ribosomal protein L18a [Medicago truncatula]
MYKEFRDTTLNGAVDLMYNETASRHRVCFPCIQIIKTATIPAKLCKRESTKQFHDSKDQVPIGFQENHTTTQEAEDNIQGQEAELVYSRARLIAFMSTLATAATKPFSTLITTYLNFCHLMMSTDK